MAELDVYDQIALRTGGELYIGVVGPVRTGKSTLIRRLMDCLVLPALEDEKQRQRMRDELPQSGSGKTVMTTQMQFIPSETPMIDLTENTRCAFRLVDCVGYMVDGALGMLEDGQPRMVRTPWFPGEVPFAQAAEVGTRKVICDHSAIGIVVTTDGSVTELPREAYVSAEKRVVCELQALGKPFVVVLNSADPQAASAQELARDLRENYSVPVLPADVLHMEREQIRDLLTAVLHEFPVSRVELDVPGWIRSLDRDHPIWQSILGRLRSAGGHMHRLRDHAMLVDAFAEGEYFSGLRIDAIRPESGAVHAFLEVPGSLYYSVLSESCGCTVRDETELMGMMGELVKAKREYDRMAGALEQVRSTGYGLIAPSMEELSLEEPKVVKHGGQFGVRLRASAPSWHLMRVDIDTEVSPVVGTEHQSEELTQYLLSGFEKNPEEIWQTEIFGKSLHDLVREGLNQKLMRMPGDVQAQLRGTLERIVNDGTGGVVCIVL